MSECIKTACGLDCYDACSILADPKVFPKIKGDKMHPVGNGALCALLNKYMHEEARITKPRIDGKEVSMEEVLTAVVEAFRADETLLWRGSGNLGVMQDITNLFIEKVGGTLTSGSLCDGAGDAGICKGRGVNRTLPWEQIAKAETIVVWGRNLTVTNAHMMPFIRDKEIIVIDPVRTEIAKQAALHLQINPAADFDVAIALSHLLLASRRYDAAALKKSRGLETFFDFSTAYCATTPTKSMGVDKEVLERFAEMIAGKRVVFLVGAGVQKYITGSYTLRAIDALAAVLGLFGKKGCGVHYLGNSRLGFSDPFAVDVKRVSKAVTPFSRFKTVLIQGGNPAASMPDTQRVVSELSEVNHLIYFGLYENETSRLAKIVIPAKSFFEKNDFRLSYAHQYVERIRPLYSSEIGIDEYLLTRYLFDAFGFKGLKSEAHYLSLWRDRCGVEKMEQLISPVYDEIPYQKGFGITENEPFFFLGAEVFERYRTLRGVGSNDKRFWLLSPKSSKSLNTQFIRDDRIRMHPASGFVEGEEVCVSSEYGEHTFQVTLSEDIKPNCVLISNNTVGVNFLTPSMLSDEGENACYQEVKVMVERV